MSNPMNNYNQGRPMYGNPPAPQGYNPNNQYRNPQYPQQSYAPQQYSTQQYSAQQYYQNPQAQQAQQQRHVPPPQQYRPPQTFGQQYGTGQSFNQSNPSVPNNANDANNTKRKSKEHGDGLSEDELERMLDNTKKKVKKSDSSESSDDEVAEVGNNDVLASAMSQSNIPKQHSNTPQAQLEKRHLENQQAKATGAARVTTQPQIKPQGPVPQKQNASALSNLPDAGEATVYKLSTGDTSNGGSGEEFFVELKAYANLRKERDQILGENSKMKADGNKGSSSGGTDAFMDSVQSSLLMDLRGEKQVSLNQAREIVQQRKGHHVLQELCKYILSQEEDKNSARVDAGWMKSMSQKIKELEESNTKLQEINNVVKQANADLTIESRRKVDNAITEAKQASSLEKDAAERALNNRIKELEQNVRQLQEMKQNVEKANSDLIHQANSRQQEMQEALNQARQGSTGDMRNYQRKIQELENYNRQLQELNSSVKQANADLTNESREKLEIALEEVKKANAAEKALKMEKRNFMQNLDNSKAMTDSLTRQMQDMSKREQAYQEKIKQLEDALRNRPHFDGNTANLREAYQGLQRSNQSRLAEISQLKVVIDRITKENTMWSSEIKDFRNKPACRITDHEARNTNFVKIREAFLENNNIDQSSKKSLSDPAVSDLIIDVLKEHVGMKRHYASEIMNSVDKLRKLGRKVHEKDQESAAYEKLAAQKDQAVSMLNKKLLSTIGDMKSKTENAEGLNKKCQLWSDRANRTMKEVEMLKKLIEPEKEKSEKMEKLLNKSKDDNESLKTKLVSAVKEIDNYKELKSKAATQFANMKEDFKTLQKDAVQLKNNLSKAVEKIKDLQGNQLNDKDSKIDELKKDNENLKKEKADLLKKIKWAKEHVTALDSKHNQLEQEVSKGKNINTEIYWERSKMEDELKAAKDEIEKLKSDGKKSGSGDKNNNSSEVQKLKDLLAKKEEELVTTKGETAKFQINMKKDLEKIKQMSLAHTSSKEKDAKEIKDYKKEIEQLKKENEAKKVQLQIMEGYNKQLRTGKNGSGPPGPPAGLPSMSGDNDGSDSTDSSKKTSKTLSDKKNKAATTFNNIKKERFERGTEGEESDMPASPPKSSKSKGASSGGESFDLPLE